MSKKLKLTLSIFLATNISFSMVVTSNALAACGSKKNITSINNISKVSNKIMPKGGQQAKIHYNNNSAINDVTPMHEYKYYGEPVIWDNQSINSDYNGTSSNVGYTDRGDLAGGKFTGADSKVTFNNPIIPNDKTSIKFKAKFPQLPSAAEGKYTIMAPANGSGIEAALNSDGSLTFSIKQASNTLLCCKVDASKLIDSKWHTVLFTSSYGEGTLYIDDLAVPVARAHEDEGYRPFSYDNLTLGGGIFSLSDLQVYNTVLDYSVKVSSISLDKDNISLKALESADLTATVAPENALEKHIHWVSNDKNVAEVDEKGHVTAIAKGTATITAMTSDGSQLSKNCTVNVTDGPAPVVPIHEYEYYGDHVIYDGNPSVNSDYNGTNSNVGYTDRDDLDGGKFTGPDSKVVFNNPIIPSDKTSIKFKTKFTKLPSAAEGRYTIMSPANGSGIEAALNSDGSLTFSIKQASNTLLCCKVDASKLIDSKWHTVLFTSSYGEGTLYIDDLAIPVASAHEEEGYHPFTYDNLTLGGGIFSLSDLQIYNTVLDYSVKVSSISLDKDNISLKALESADLTATVAPENALEKHIHWISSDKNVAEVDEKGHVTAIAKGTATITAMTSDGSQLSKDCTVNVTDGPAPVVPIHEYEYYGDHVIYDGNPSVNSDYNGTNSNVGYTDRDDLDGGKFTGADSKVTFNNAIIPNDKTSIKFKTKFTKLPSAAEGKYTIMAPANGNGIEAVLNSDGSLTFSIKQASNTLLCCKVDASKLIDSKWHTILFTSSYGEGTLYIDDLAVPVARAHEDEGYRPFSYDNLTLGGGIFSLSDLQIYNTVLDYSVKVSSISINKNNLTLKALESADLTATVAPENALEKHVHWVSSNKNVAEVDENGHVTAIAKGTATITAMTSDGSQLSKNCTVNVTDGPDPVAPMHEYEYYGGSVINDDQSINGDYNGNISNVGYTDRGDLAGGKFTGADSKVTFNNPIIPNDKTSIKFKAKFPQLPSAAEGKYTIMAPANGNGIEAALNSDGSLTFSIKQASNTLLCCKVDASKLIDSKWHTILFTSSYGGGTLYIDDLAVPVARAHEDEGYRPFSYDNLTLGGGIFSLSDLQIYNTVLDYSTKASN